MWNYYGLMCKIKSDIISHTMYLPTFLHKIVSCGSSCLPKQERSFGSVVFSWIYELTLTLTYNSWNEVIIVMFICFCWKTNINLFSWCLNVFKTNENAIRVKTKKVSLWAMPDCTNVHCYKTQDCLLEQSKPGSIKFKIFYEIKGIHRGNGLFNWITTTSMHLQFKLLILITWQTL